MGQYIKRHGCKSAHALAVFFALVFSSAAFAWPATVDHVADGDTVTVIQSQSGRKFRVRLAGIDAPETSHGHGREGQRYGNQSKQTLKWLLRQGQVAVHPNGTTSYDRIVATITVDGTDVGRVLVAAGMAWNYPRYSPDYSAAQAKAKQNHEGLWQQANPTPPWDWRHHHWTR